jgi:hypothetical protein
VTRHHRAQATGEIDAGVDIGTLDQHNDLHSPSGRVVGAVSALRVVRDCTGSIVGAVTSTGTVVDTSLAPVPQATCRGAEVWSDHSGLVGIIQGLPPPLLTLVDISNTSEKESSAEHGSSEAAEGESSSGTVNSSSRHFSVAWSDLCVTGRDGKNVGRWCPRRGAVVDEAGEEVMSLAVERAADGPSGSLPQAVDQDGNFLGHVLPSRAVVDSSGHQVQHCQPWHRKTGDRFS